jgi:fibronectin-binding autotransporter adhesin
MTRRNLFSNRNSLSRRVLGMMVSLFRRRWGATPVRRSQHVRLADRMRNWVGGATESAARVVNSHLLTLSQPEFLEQRSMMAVTANSTGTSDTLAVWLDGDNDQAYIRQMGDSTGLLQISTTPDFGNLIYNNRVPSKLYVYDGANLSVDSTPASGGSGYVDAPAVTVSNTTFGWIPLSVNTTLNATAVNLTAAGSKYVVGDSFSVTQTGRPGAVATVSVTGVDVNGNITGTKITANGSNFTSFSGATVKAFSAAGTGATLTLNGSVNALNGTLSGIGYYRMPQVTIAASPTGAQATATTTITTSTTWLNGRVAVDEQSSPLTSDVRIGQYYQPGGTQTDFNALTTLSNAAWLYQQPWAVRLSGIETVQFAGSSTGELWVQDADDISVQGAFNSLTEQVNLSVLGGGAINIGAPMTVGCVVAHGGANLNVSGGLNAGWFDLGSNNVAISGPINSNGSAMIMAVNNLSMDAPISTGNGTGEYVLLQATGGTLAINSAVTASNGGITLSAPTISGAGLITGRNLSIQEGGGAVNYSLNANVSNLSGNTASNLTFDNLRDLNIGGGALNLRGAANTLLLSSDGNLNVGANVVMQTGGNLVLNAGKGVAITGTIQPSGSPLDLTMTAANGSITSNTSLLLGSGNAVIGATGNVNIPSLFANRLNVSTVAGNITITEGDGVFVDNATVTGAGNITIATLSGNIGIEGVARIGGVGTATFQSNKGNISLNGSAFTQSNSSLVLSAANGTISNGASGTLATGGLTWIATAGAAAPLLMDDTISNYSKLTANITGAGNQLQVKSGRSLTLLNITTKSGAIDVNVTNSTGSPNLTISGNVTAGNSVLGTLQNITLAAPNGAINSTGVMTGNVLLLSALNSTTLTNQNVSQLNATISGTGQNLTVSSSRSLRAGDIKLSGGTLNMTLSGGNLTRSGTIKTGTNGSAILNVSQGSILGNGLIDSESLNFAAIIAPDLSVANATFTRLSANITQSGSISLSRASDLTIDQAVTSFGDITFALSAGNLTINGPLTAGGNGNIALTASAGSLNTTSNVTSNITANVLTVTTLNDLVLQTDVNELIANVTGTPGNITVTEKNGLIVGSGGINAANTISITLLAGDLTRTGAVNTSTSTGNVTLNIVGGGVAGNGAINAATLNWTSKSAAAINDAFLTYSNVVANVTGAGNDLFISRSGDFAVLSATTTSGNINIASAVGGKIATGNLAINGPITAGGGKTVAISAVGGSVTSSDSTAVINTTGNVSLVAQNTSSIFTSIVGLAANVTAGDLTVVEANGLTLLGGAGNNVTASGSVTLRVGNSLPGNLSGSGYLNAGGDVTITAPNGAVTLTSAAGQINGGDLSITANGASSANTNVTNLTANITGGGLTIVEVDSITIEPTDVVATGAVAITSTGDSIFGSANGGINATGDVTLSALNGAVVFSNNANQVAGNVLTVNAKNDSSVNTAVSSLVANISAGSLTVQEANNLAIGTSSATAVVTSGDLTINIANGSLTGAGIINAGAGDVSINVSRGGITLNSSASQVRGDVLTIDSASNAVNVNTAVNAVIADITGEGNEIVVSQTGNLAINGGDIRTTNGSITIGTTGNLNRTNDIDAGTANITLTAGGAITGVGLISGNVLAVSAATATTLNTAVNGVTATLSTNLASLSITEADDLDIVLAGVNTNNGPVSISLAGSLAGNGSINAGAGNVTLNASTGGINLANGSQVVRGGVLNVTAQNETTLNTNVTEITAIITGTGEGLTVREADGLAINAPGVVTDDGLIDIATATGNINGTGAINAGSGDVALNAVAGNVNLALASNQVRGANLTVVAQSASTLNTHIDDLNAAISVGGLTVVDFDDLAIDLGSVTAGGAISLTAGNASTAADITGAGTIAAATGAANVALTAAGGKVVLNTTSGQVVGSTLTVTAKDDASVNTQVANLIANVTTGGLNVTDVDSLNIGTSSTSNVIAAGDIAITLDSGSLAGSGTINANAGANNVSLTLAGSGNVVLNSAGNQVVGNVLNVSATSGVVNLNSAVNTVTVQTNDFGVAINQSQALTVKAIVADGNVNIVLSSGDLQIDSGSILGAQVSNITLNVANGAINSVDIGSTGNVGVVFGNVLDIRAQNSSDIATTVTTLTANITGDAQSLTVTDGDDPTDNIADGLSIGAAGVLTKGGDVVLNVMTVDNTGVNSTAVANLGGTGNISTLNTTNNVAGNITLNVANGAANFTARAGQITGNVLMLSVVNNSTINTNVATLDQFNAPAGVAISGQNQILTINEVTDLAVGPGNIVATNGSDLVINVGGNLTVSATGGALLADNGVTKGNITLNASAGSIGSPSAELDVTANVLNINRAQNNVYVNTTVDLLNANVTIGLLTVVESGSLSIGSISANGVVLNVTGEINGAGVINSANGVGNVTLSADNISLTATNQVIGNVLNVTVVNTSSLNTRVNTLAAAITGGAGQNLTISEANDLIINSSIGDVTSNGGDLNLTLRSGNLTGNGVMNADTGNIYLNTTAGSINLTGTLTADALDVRSLTNAAVTTNVSTLTANVSSGSLTVTESNSLSIGAGNVTAFSGVSITAGSKIAAGSIDGAGFLTATAGNVLLSTPNGSVNLTANAGQVAGSVFTLNASGNSEVNTNVSTLVANISGANNGLTINEVNSLSIGSGNVVTASGDITIITGGDLSRTGNITAGSKAPNAGADVTLRINGATSGTGVITADVLNLTAVNSTSVNTSINTLIANITRDGQSLSVFEAAGLNIAGGNVTTVNGAISVNVATGDLNVTGSLTAGSGNVTLNVLTGGINASGDISGNVLTVLAANTSRLDTAVNSVVANITGAGNTLNIVDIDTVSIGTGGLKTNNGVISVTAGSAGTGTLTIANPINAGTGNVTLTNNNGAINGTANGLVSGNVLNVVVKSSSTLSTNVTTLVGNITGANQVLTITETANGLQIGAANLVASGANGGINLTVANGSLNGSGSINTANGPITIGVTNGNLNTTGSINAGTGNLTFNVNGVVNLTGSNQVSGNVLSLTANGTSLLNTAITSLVANITGAGNTLSVTDTNGLTVGGNGVVTNNGNITLTSGKDSAGDLLVNGQVNAGIRTVSLTANGGINGSGLITATNLTVVSANNVLISTNVTNLAAIVTGVAKTLVVNESNGLNVSNVIATNSTTINGINASNGASAVTLNVATGSLTGNGAMNAGASGNITLNAANGGVVLNGTKQITGNVLNVTAATNSLLNTDVKTLTALITGIGQTLTVSENAGLALGSIQTNNGDLSINTATGSFTGAGAMNAGTANVTLNAAVGNITLNSIAGQIAGNVLTLRSANDAIVNTSVNGLAANITAGKLDVTEVNGLLVTSAGVRANGNVNVTLSNGDLSGIGSMTSTNGDVKLNAATGGINLTATTGQVSAANLLTVTAANTSQLNTNVASLTATVTNGSLTITESNSLTIAGTGVNTSVAGGNVAITLTTGNLNGNGVINAGAGNIAITASAGNVALNQASPPPQVVGNVLTLITKGQADVDTSINGLAANVTSTGNLTVRELNNLSVNLARTANGAVNISTTNTSTLSVFNITAATGANGNVTLTAGNVLVYSPGITASGTLNLTGVGNTTVVNGTIVAPNVTQTANNPVNWNINSNATGPGSLNQVITNINNFNGNSAVNVSTNTTVNLTGQLPTIRKSFALSGNNLLTLNGTAAGASASGLTLGANGITISGVTLRNFGGAGIDMLTGATNATITGVTVQNSAFGLRATGNLSSSIVTKSTFDGLGRANSTGALLSNAQGLKLGLNTTSFNTFQNSTVGMTATGTSTGTKVFGNQFIGNSRFGISLAAATGLQIGSSSDLSLRNMISGGTTATIGVFASGFCTGSSVNKMLFVNFPGTRYSVAQSRNLVVVQ